MSGEQRKAVIKNADMDEKMQQDAVDIASKALSEYNIEKVRAAKCRCRLLRSVLAYLINLSWFSCFHKGCCCVHKEGVRPQVLADLVRSHARCIALLNRFRSVSFTRCCPPCFHRHVIVGRNFGSYVTHETKHFIYFYLGQVAVLLFKSG
jgi:Dynein light chain type 1